MPLNASQCLSLPLNASQCLSAIPAEMLEGNAGKGVGGTLLLAIPAGIPQEYPLGNGGTPLPLNASQCLSAIPAEMLDFTQIPRLPPARRAGLPLGTCVGLRGRRPLWRSGSVPSALLPLPGGNWGNAAPWGGPTGRRHPKGRNPEGRRPASRGTPPRPRARVRPPGARTGPRAAAYGVLGIKVLLLPLPPAGG